MLTDRLLAFHNQTVLVLGDIMLDCYIDGNVGRISPEAPVPVLAVVETLHHLGGAGNVAGNIIALGAQVRLVSAWGQDPAGDVVASLLHTMGADTTFSRQYTSLATIQKTRLVARRHQLFRYDVERIEPAKAEFVASLTEHEDALFNGVTAVIISDYGKGLVTEQTAQFIINSAKKRGLPVLVDPKNRDYSIYRGATACTPNLKELIDAVGGNALSSEDDILSAGGMLIDRYDFEYLLVTRSERGLSLIENGEKHDFPAVVQEVTDVTGAGDTVISTFALALGTGLSLGECCRLANRAAAVVVSKFGAATVSPEELSRSDKLIISAKLLARDLHSQGKRIVFTNGCFDLVHAGHIKSFEQARSFGDVLIVGLNSDRSVKAIKGPARPIVSQDDRARLLCALSCVDYVVIFDEETPERLIREIAPNVLVKGADWRGKTVAGQDIVEASGGCVEFIELEQGLSTTAIIEKIKAN